MKKFVLPRIKTFEIDPLKQKVVSFLKFYDKVQNFIRQGQTILHMSCYENQISIPFHFILIS